MKRCLYIGLFLLLAVSSVEGQQNWPSFRGANRTGIAEGFETAVSWDVATGENIKWKREIAGLAHSSVVVWGDRIYVTTVTSSGGEQALKVGLYYAGDSAGEDADLSWHVMCLERASGKILWDKIAYTGRPKVKRHPKNSHASSSPATDGEYVVAFFGSEGLYCYDKEGNLAWSKDYGVVDFGYFGRPSMQWGAGASPIIVDGKVIVQCDCQGEDFLAAYKVENGEEIWKTERDDYPSWSTPLVYKDDHGAQIVCNGFKHGGGYDLQTGAEIWKITAGLGDEPITSPIPMGDLIFLTSTHGRFAPLLAIRPTAKGDITLPRGETTNEYIVWSNPRGGNYMYMTTPMFYRGYLYLCADDGRLYCYEPKTGAVVYQEKLEVARRYGFTASPVAADGKIYFTEETGKVFVLEAGPEFKTPVINEMGDICMATPAIVEGVIYFRTHHWLAAVEEK